MLSPIKLTIAWLLGLVLARWLWHYDWLGCHGPAWMYWAIAGVFLLALAWRIDSNYRPLILFALLVLLGAARYHASPFTPCFGPHDLAYYNGPENMGRPAVLVGIVDDYPDIRDRTAQYRLRVQTIEIDGTEISVNGNALVQAWRYPTYNYGDRLRVSGMLQTPPELPGFNYREFLQRRGISALVRRPQIELIATDQGEPFWTWLYAFRERGAKVLNRTLPEPQASLANGMILGIESGIPRELYDKFNLTGTSHVIVISGSKVAIVSAVLLALWTRLLGRRRAIVPTLIGLIFYMLLVGAGASVTRATIMGSLYVLAMGLGRQAMAVNSLFIAALVMTLANPLMLWDVGFQLSAGATFGLIVFTQPMQAWVEERLRVYFPAERLRAGLGLINDAILVNVAANIAILPLVIYYFGRISLITLLSNALIIPVQPYIMLWGATAVLLGQIWLPIGQLLNWIPWLCLTYTAAVVEWTAGFSWAVVEPGRAGQLGAIAYYIVFIGWILRRWLTTEHPGWNLPGGRQVALAACVAFPLGISTAAIAERFDHHLRVHYIDLDPGEAVLIRSPAGQRVLFVERGGGEVLDDAVRAHLPPWMRTSLTLDRYPRPGTQVVLKDGVRLRALGIDDDSALWFLEYGRLHLLLHSHLTAAQQRALHENHSPVTAVLRGPPVAAGVWPEPWFITAVTPHAFLWPVEATYPPATVAALARIPTIDLEPGTSIELVSNGEHFWLRRGYTLP